MWVDYWEEGGKGYVGPPLKLLGGPAPRLPWPPSLPTPMQIATDNKACSTSLVINKTRAQGYDFFFVHKGGVNYACVHKISYETKIVLKLLDMCVQILTVYVHRTLPRLNCLALP